ncbi:acetyltransferase [Bacillus thuringiensis]|uniref:GNAT family N-acetyltransferase n=1 Tax=Bacillus cereus TaxID=1396 RepID=A0ABD4LGZ0_BACCE|nr:MULTISPECIES: GNAT family protein [Bacillus cereus group]MBG9579024.1 acetyltransferase [Bacillus thuringiensis]AJG59710.1 acetyltransferase family protein [Bacillus cereus D17]MBK1610067.1 GNAT family N-acetyltransferase [Bacillus cereus]MBL3877156.1 GNAT family N-acetyltransferase [Bacillus cereus]MBR9694464.1 N-acetyltransferase [Bacillus cereus]
MKTIETERLILRSLQLDDAPVIEKLAGDYLVAKTTLSIPHPYPKGSAKDFITHMLQAETDKKIVIFSILGKNNKELLGVINLNLNRIHKRGELAYWIGRPYWGNGFGTEAAKALLHYGFNALHLNKIFAASFTNNPGSWRIMEKIGMNQEGTFKQHVIKYGESIDLTYYGILLSEYK